jgi:hypothetical protein
MSDNPTSPMDKKYPELEHLLIIYFGQDYWYNLDEPIDQPTFKDMMRQYLKDGGGGNNMLIYDIASWKLDHENDSDPDASFMKDFGAEIDPVLWGYQPMDFLNEIEKIVKQNKVE